MACDDQRDAGALEHVGSSVEQPHEMLLRGALAHGDLLEIIG
jgi:hypothetical protein